MALRLQAASLSATAAHILPLLLPPLFVQDMLLEWWYDPIAVPNMQLDENNTASGLNLPSLTVLPDAIPNGGAITINVNFSLNPLSPKLKVRANDWGQ